MLEAPPTGGRRSRGEFLAASRGARSAPLLASLALNRLPVAMPFGAPRRSRSPAAATVHREEAVMLNRSLRLSILTLAMLSLHDPGSAETSAPASTERPTL